MGGSQLLCHAPVLVVLLHVALQRTDALCLSRYPSLCLYEFLLQGGTKSRSQQTSYPSSHAPGHMPMVPGHQAKGSRQAGR